MGVLTDKESFLEIRSIFAAELKVMKHCIDVFIGLESRFLHIEKRKQKIHTFAAKVRKKVWTTQMLCDVLDFYGRTYYNDY